MSDPREICIKHASKLPLSDDMVKDLGKLKSFGNFKNDFSDNWGGGK